MKKILLIVFTAFLLLFPNIVKADNPNVLHVENNPRVIDEENLLTATQEQALTEKLQALKDTYGLDVVIVIPISLNNQSPQVYADDFYDYNNYSDDGVLLLLCLEDRDWYVSTKGKGITYVTDYGLDYAADKFVSYFSNEDYNRGFEVFCACMETLFAEAKENKPIDIHNPVREMTTKHIYISLIVSSVVTLIVVLILKGQLKSVKTQHYAQNYIVPNSYRQVGYSNYFTGTTRTQRRIERHDSNSGGSHSHSSSSGSNHGGGGGKF